MTQVTNITPTANDTNAKKDDSNIVITFSENIDKSTVEDNIIVRGSQTGIIKGEFTVSDDKVTFDPTSPFKVGEQITVEVTSGVKSTSGADTTAKIHQFTVETTSGTGNFSQTTQSLGSSDSRDVSLGDVNGDDNLSQTTQSLGSSSSRGVSLGDVNGDDDLDAFVANDGENKVWFNNLPIKVTEITPTANDTNAKKDNSDIVITFSENIDESTATKDNIKVRGSQTGIIKGEFKVSDDKVTFNPTSPFKVGEQITVEVTSGVKSTSGLDTTAKIHQFTVETTSGTGNFSQTTQSFGSSWSRGVSLGDVNGDGHLDAFVANSSDANKVWLNDGSGNFNDSSQSLGSSWSWDVSLGDVNGDGHLDAFVANYRENKVWLNDGSANFSQTTQSLGSSSSRGV
ncbi:MAG: Ig-like domain-containing protein, partial [Calothrix sp. MO_167.B42]|nr:Ig-like domain-containing protein [Calothrix sp. MO_167.B42]